MARADAAPAQAQIVRGRIEGSLFLSAVEAGASPEASRSALALFARRVDLTRDLEDGDRFSLLIEPGAEQAKPVVRFAEVTTRWGLVRLYALERPSGEPEVVDEAGRSLDRELLRTPVDASRISSVFGPRRHPILGYTRMHQGVDFAAPAGAPVYAAADGAIAMMGWAGGYGRELVLDHGGRLQSAYAHLSAFAPGIARGSHVRQGQVIGYVGMSGLATGPHLHYEVLREGRRVNPQAGGSLSGPPVRPDPVAFASLRTQVIMAGLDG